MKKIFLILTLILFPTFCLASPFLVCDPQEGVEYYVLEINGVLVEGIPAESDGSIRYDLAGLAEGAFTIMAKAGNEWGRSEWSLPLVDTKAVPMGPSGLRVFSP